MDRISKYLKKLKSNEQKALRALLLQLMQDYTRVPGKNPIQGKKAWYKVRIGGRRVIFRVIDAKRKKVSIERVQNRDERTYKNL
jgi:mRNA-degrading endonuclease RelE of RelBE toxin-antitoxin system